MAAIFDFNVHPPLTAFPLVCLALTALFEIVFLYSKKDKFREFSRWLIWIAALGTAAAFFSGYQASELANQTFVIDDANISNHHSFGRLLLFWMIAVLGFHYAASYAERGQNFFNAAYRVTLLLAVALVLYTGWLGGLLIFEHGAGVWRTQ